MDDLKTLHEKMDRIIALLEEQNRQRTVGYPAQPVREAVEAWRKNAAPGRYYITDISVACGFGVDRASVQAVAKALDHMNVQRWRSSTGRGFAI